MGRGRPGQVTICKSVVALFVGNGALSELSELSETRSDKLSHRTAETAKTCSSLLVISFLYIPSLSTSHIHVALVTPLGVNS